MSSERVNGVPLCESKLCLKVAVLSGGVDQFISIYVGIVNTPVDDPY